MIKTVVIYCLKDPLTNDIRYIGKTWSSLNERLRLHIISSKRSKKPTRKDKWIISLLNKKVKPLIETLIQTSEENWRNDERYWIQEGKSKGWPLLNLKRGGGGYDNLTHSETWKKKLRKRMKGNKYGFGKKWTEEQRKLMMKSRKNPWNKDKTGLQKHTKKWKKEHSVRMKNENHPMVKLSNNDITKIRNRFKFGESKINISKDYSVSYSHICKIINKKIR